MAILLHTSVRQLQRHVTACVLALTVLAAVGLAAEPESITVPENYAELSVPARTLQHLAADDLPVYLQNALIYRPTSPAGDFSDGVTEFTVTRSGRVFLAATWVYGSNVPNEVKDEITSQADLMRSGWVRLRRFPWEQHYELFVRYCREGETFRLRTSDRLPPLPILGGPVDLAADDLQSGVSDEEAQALFRAQICELRDREDIERLEAAVTGLRSSKSKFPSGLSKLNLFYYAVGADSLSTLDPPWGARLEFLERWMGERPQSATPHICAAQLLERYGWQARGTALAKDVTERQWTLFRERLAQAREHLDKAQPLVQNDPVLYKLLVRCAWGLGDDPDRVRQYALKTLEIDPTFVEGVRDMAVYLLPQWHGRPGDLHAFGVQAVEKSKHAFGAGMYLYVHDAISNLPSDNVGTDEFQWPLLRQAYLDLLERYPAAGFRRAELIQAAHRAGDRKTAASAMGQVGDAPEQSGFNDLSVYEYYRTALRPDVSDGDQKLLIDDVLYATTSLTFSPDGSRLASMSRYRTFGLWNPSTGAKLVEPYNLDGLTDCLVFADAPDLIVGGAKNGSVYVRSIHGDPSADFSSIGKHARGIVSLAHSRSGHSLMSASMDGVIRIWNGESGTLKKQLNAAHGGNLAAAAMSKDGLLLASTGRDGKVKLWDGTSWRIRREWPLTAGQGQSLAFSPDGRLLAAGHGENQVTIWNLQDGKVVASTELPDKGPGALAFSPKGTVLAIGCFSGQNYLVGGAYTWKFATESPQKLKGHTCGVQAVAFPETEPVLATGGADWTIRIWDIAE